jgi:hypothetical protein
MPTYCTAQDVKNATRNTVLKAETQPVIESLIEQAELIIDEYVAFVQSPTDQVLKFPRIGDTGIPAQVKYATIYQVEYMYEKAPDLDHGISDESGEKNVQGKKYDVMSHRAKHLLKTIRQIVGKPFSFSNKIDDVTIF